MKRADENDYEALAQRAGFTWLGPLPENMLEKTNWRCSHGHEFAMRGANVYMAIHAGGRGCPYCSRRWRRRGVDYQTLAKKNGILWVGGVVPPNTRAPTRWRFPDGPEFMMSYRSIAARSSRICDTGLRADADIIRSQALVDGGA